MPVCRKNLATTILVKRLSALREHSFYSRYVPVAADGVIDKPATIKQFLDRHLPMPLTAYYLWEWNCSLKYTENRGNTVVCWAEGIDRNLVRKAAARLDKLFKAGSFSPVLVTSSVDFTFFIRMGWLVEYLPVISGKSSYSQKKAVYLSLRYRNAIFMPIEAGLGNLEECGRILGLRMMPV